ncbi:MAG: Tim44/TimA family putative adaptor protein [Holosporales bacterium]|jgi:hypothetical protein|nr:Tim44/TimA family putative adaptor protein [Holosporales bacterium]
MAQPGGWVYEGEEMSRVLFFIIITCILLFQLHAVLGRESGPRSSALDKKNLDKMRKFFKETVHLSKEEERQEGTFVVESPISREFWKACPTFHPETFLKGASKAFLYVQEAYAARDRTHLKEILTEALFQVFDEALTASEQRGETMEQTFLELRTKRLKTASVREEHLCTEVEFVSEQCLVVKDAQGVPVMGSADLIRTVTDVWTFVRPMAARSSKWYVANTLLGEKTAESPFKKDDETGILSS